MNSFIPLPSFVSLSLPPPPSPAHRPDVSAFNHFCSPRDQGPALGPEASQSKSVNWEEGGREGIKRKWGPLLPATRHVPLPPGRWEEEEKELPLGEIWREKVLLQP